MSNSDNLENPYTEEGDDPYNYDYQPFANNRNTEYEDVTDSKEYNDSMTIQSSNYNPNSTNSPYMDEVHINQGDDEIRRKEMELAAKEKELAEREQLASGKAKNFPICYPLLRHSFDDITQKFRRLLAISGFIGFILFSVVLVLNFFCAFVAITPFGKPSGQSNTIATLSGFKYIFFSVMFIIVGIPLNFFTAYWPLYKAMLTCNFLRFIIFTIGYVFPILFCLFGATGYYEYGPSGLVLIVQMFPFLGAEGNTLVFFLNLIMFTLWLFIAIYHFVLFLLVIKVFRDQNGTFKKAKEFANSEFVKTVSSTMSNVVGANDEGPGATPQV